MIETTIDDAEKIRLTPIKHWRQKTEKFYLSGYVTNNSITDGIKNYVYNNYLKVLPPSNGDIINHVIMRYNLEVMKITTTNVHTMCVRISKEFEAFREWTKLNYSPLK